jgi:hypothetical protein
MRTWSPLLLLCLAGSAWAQEPGVSETLARDRAARVSNVRYDLSFSIPADRTTAIRGHEVITFALTDASAPLVIDFDAGDAPLNRNDDYLYTIFVPARAHEAFPCSAADVHHAGPLVGCRRAREVLRVAWRRGEPAA